MSKRGSQFRTKSMNAHMLKPNAKEHMDYEVVPITPRGGDKPSLMTVSHMQQNHPLKGYMNNSNSNTIQ